jgi:hypothetical protein
LVYRHQRRLWLPGCVIGRLNASSGGGLAF